MLKSKKTHKEIVQKRNKIVTLQPQNSENPMHSMMCRRDESGLLQKDVIIQFLNHQ